MKIKIPTYIKVYMTGTVILFIVCLTLLLLQIFKAIYIVHPYLLVCGFIASIGLFVMEVLSIFDYKRFINKL